MRSSSSAARPVRSSVSATRARMRPGVHAAQRGHEGQVLADAHLLVERGHLGEEADAGLQLPRAR